jgi:tRNA-2-methylthio-N6-dimethylallyladenosine synthase
VHFSSDTEARPGDFVDVKIQEASAHYLIGDATNVVKTRGGDAHEMRTAPASEKSSAASPNTQTILGIPTVRTI